MLQQYKISFLFIALGAALLALETVTGGIMAEVVHVGGLFFLVFGLIDLFQRRFARRKNGDDGGDTHHGQTDNGDDE